MAEGDGYPVAPRRDRSRPSRRDEPAGHLRRWRLHDRALQADRDRDGRRVEGGAVGVRLYDPPPGRTGGRGGVTRRSLRRVDRKSVVKGKSVSVRVDLGGRWIIKKKTEKATDNAGNAY